MSLFLLCALTETPENTLGLEVTVVVPAKLALINLGPSYAKRSSIQFLSEAPLKSVEFHVATAVHPCTTQRSTRTLETMGWSISLGLNFSVIILGVGWR